MANILIIDDDPHITRLLQMHLSDEGYEVFVAYRGNDGLALALKEPPDLILLDVILPDLTGFQMCSLLRKTAATSQVPILMMTGVARFPNQKQFAMDRGANEYILKPFKIFELSALVNRYIGMNRKEPAPALSAQWIHPSSAPSATSREEKTSELQAFLKRALPNAESKH